MKNKKKILSLIACLSLLSACNKTSPSSSSCSITTSTTINSTPTLDIESEIINPFDYANYSIYNLEGSKYFDKPLKLDSFGNELTDEKKLKIEEIHIQERVNVINVTILNNTENGLFYVFNNLKRLYIPKTILSIRVDSAATTSSAFINLLLKKL